MSGDYIAYEVIAGSCNEQVETICKHLTDNGSFNNSAQITQTEVDHCITATYYEIVVWLAEFGYAAAQTNEAVIGMLEYYNALGASARVELALATTGFGAKENTRHRFLWQQYQMLRTILASDALSQLGAEELTDSRGDGLTAGGISISDKEIIEDDTDATKYSFTRKLMDNPNYTTQQVIDTRTNNPEGP